MCVCVCAHTQTDIRMDDFQSEQYMLNEACTVGSRDGTGVDPSSFPRRHVHHTARYRWRLGRSDGGFLREGVCDHHVDKEDYLGGHPLEERRGEEEEGGGEREQKRIETY